MRLRRGEQKIDVVRHTTQEVIADGRRGVFLGGVDVVAAVVDGERATLSARLAHHLDGRTGFRVGLEGRVLSIRQVLTIERDPFA